MPETTVEDRLLLINALEAEIAQPEAEAPDKRWEQARLVWEALQNGMSTRRLAAEWKKPNGETYSKSHVDYTAKTWETWGVHYSGQSFYVAFNSAEVRKRERNGTSSRGPFPRAGLADGMSTRRLAAEWKKPNGGRYDHAYVWRVAKAWEVYKAVDYSQRPTFYVAFNSDEVRKSRRNGTNEPLRLRRFAGPRGVASQIRLSVRLARCWRLKRVTIN